MDFQRWRVFWLDPECIIVRCLARSLDKLNDAVPPTNGAYPSTNGKH